MFCGEDNINHKRSRFHDLYCESQFLFGLTKEQQWKKITKFCEALAFPEPKTMSLEIYKSAQRGAGHDEAMLGAGYEAHIRDNASA
jgi:hypothetical protein